MRQRILVALAAAIIVGLQLPVNHRFEASQHAVHDDATVVFGVS